MLLPDSKTGRRLLRWEPQPQRYGELPRIGEYVLLAGRDNLHHKDRQGLGSDMPAGQASRAPGTRPEAHGRVVCRFDGASLSTIGKALGHSPPGT